MSDIGKGIETALLKCLEVAKDESVLIVTDTDLCELGEMFYDKACELDLNVTLVKMRTLEMNGQEPNEIVRTAMMNADNIFLVTTKSLSHTRARQKASLNGSKCASLPNLNIGMLEGAMLCDYDKVVPLSDKLAEKITNGKTARVVTKLGTDLTFSLEGREGRTDTGMYNKPGLFGNLPAGEGFVAPLEGSANGVLVVDASMAGVGLLKSPLTIKIENGLATEITGEDAATLIDILDRAGENSRNVAELGIGTNEKARLSGAILEDEKVLGTIHVALGDNFNFGGNVEADCHLDGVVTKVSLWIDDELIIDEGKMLI